MNESEFLQQRGILDRAIKASKTVYKGKPDYILLAELVRRRDELVRSHKSAQIAEREKVAMGKISTALAAAPLIMERADEIVPKYARQPFIHQVDGAVQLASAESGLLADKPRLGKNFTSHIWSDLLDLKRVLIFTEKDIQSTIQNQYHADGIDEIPIAKLGQMTQVSRNITLDLLKAFPRCKVILNYESIRRDERFVQQLIDFRFDGLILDEAHNLNKTGTKTWQAIWDIRSRLNWCPRHRDLYRDVVKSADGKKTFCADCMDLAIEMRMESSISHVLPMTGTPILNRPRELYPILKLFAPDEFKKETDFLYEYTNGGDGWSYRGHQKLLDKMGPRIVQRSAKDAGIEIPPQDPILHEIEFDEVKYPEQADVLKQIAEKAAIILEELADGGFDAIGIPSVLAEITRMRQAVTWPAGISIACGRCYDCMTPNKRGVMTGSKCAQRKRVNVYESQKLDAVEKQIRVLLDSGERILVFSQFNEPLFELERRLGNRSVSFTGKTPEHIKDAIKADFLYDPFKTINRWDVLLVNSKTGGSGLDLAGADIEVIIDEEWNPGKTEQRDNRVINMLKKKTTQVHTFRQLDSIDVWMAEIIAKKQESINEFESSRAIIDYLVKKFLKGNK